MSNNNPFRFAIACKGPGLHRAHWYSGDGATSKRIHAMCWPDRATADKACAELSKLNPDYTFEVRQFSK